jgi:hypothetical protein
MMVTVPPVLTLPTLVRKSPLARKFETASCCWRILAIS